jgi:hypothetical protein
MSSIWKKEVIAKLGINPVMPLRECLDPGEVYRYRDRPKSFYEDGQGEPPIAFNIEALDVKEGGARSWPELHFEGNQKSSITAAIESIGKLSWSIENDDDIYIKLTGSFAKLTPLDDIQSKFLEKNGTKFTVREKYIDKIRPQRFRSRLRPSEKNDVYLRIPAEVYFVSEIEVSVSRARKTNSELTLDKEVIEKLSSLNAKVSYDDKINIKLDEKFPKPMAIGYTGLLYKVNVKNGEAYEIPEDPR